MLQTGNHTILDSQANFMICFVGRKFSHTSFCEILLSLFYEREWSVETGAYEPRRISK